jgi:hypothetical protein
MIENNDLPIRDVAVIVLREVALDKAAPAAARGAAARSLAEIAGLLGRNAEGAQDIESKSLSEMNASEIDAEIRRLSRTNPRG